ncbi:MAG: hypothetical protein HC906_16125 [Bacteroidales bacterium]|nr:hypothetical protein [Bacteroidales bacterium]
MSSYVSKGSSIRWRYQFHPRFTFKSGITVTGISALLEKETFNYFTDYTFSFNYKNLKYNFQLSAFFKQTGERALYRGNYDENENLSSIDEAFISGFRNMDVNLSVPVLKNKIVLGTGVHNIFNVKSIYSSGSLSPHSGGDGSTPIAWGRTFVFKINYRFIQYE